MKRKDFLKQLGLTGASISLLPSFDNKENCVATPSDEEGPFPTKKPFSLTTENIIQDRAGTPLLIHISIHNINNACKPLHGALVDIWHCDSKGEYSEYGGSSGMMPPPGDRKDFPLPPPPSRGNDSSRPFMPPPFGGGGMQIADHTKEHFLRGRQITNTNGLVSFTSIFPGWYPGRAPHIHVHVYDKKGKSLLISQIAFPEEISNSVYAQGEYKDHGMPDTSNMSDHVFNDSIANELASVTGNNTDGYILSHAIYVKA